LKHKGYLRFAARDLLLRPLIGSRAALVCAGLAVCVSLGGCQTSTNVGPSIFDSACAADQSDVVDGIDWSEVQPYRLHIINGDYRPMVMSLEQNRPYVLVLENADKTDHDFWAPDFLKNGVALKSVQFGDKAPGRGCFNGVRLKARSTVTLRFVPVWEGRYEVRDVNFILTPTIGATAVINVVQPRLGVAVK
jgi:hypothetical protein